MRRGVFNQDSGTATLRTIYLDGAVLAVRVSSLMLGDQRN
jgi:hypothetical protein